MKNTLIFLLLTFLFSLNISAQGWEKAYDFAVDTGKDILQTDSGEIYFLSNKTIADTSSSILFSQIDTEGNLLNTIEFSSDSLLLSASTFSQTADGGFVIGGTGKNSNDSRFYGLLIKLLPDGTEEWRQLLTSSNKFIIVDVLESSLGDFMITGSDIHHYGGSFFTLMKTNSNGDELWTNQRFVYTSLNYCGMPTCTPQDYMRQIVEINPNHFLATGSLLEAVITDDEPVYYKRGYWLEIDSLGNEINDIVRLTNNGFRDIKRLADGNFITTYLANDNHFAVEKLDATGNRFWQFNLPDSIVSSQINLIPNGDIIIAGNKSISYEKSNYILMRYDESGIEYWRKEYAYHNRNGLAAVILDASENSYLIGSTLSDQFSDIFIVKTDAEGNTKTNEINGFAYFDTNDNCLFDADDYPLENYQIEIEELPNYQIFTDENGEFSTLVNAGINTISTVPIDFGWVACTPVIFHDFSIPNESISVEFAIRDTCPEITSDIFLNSICGDGNGEAYISSTGGVGEFSYEWSTGETGESINDLSEGDYSVTVNSGTCADIETFEYEFLDAYISTPVNTYGGSKSDYMKEVFNLPDGGYLLTGESKSNDGDVSVHYYGSIFSRNFWFVRLDSERNILWEKSYGGTGTEFYGQTIELANGNFLTVGSTSSMDVDISNPNEGSSAWILEIDANGNIVREKSFGGSQYENFFSVVEMSDGSLAIGGRTSSNDGDLTENNGSIDMWILRLDVDWNIIWSENIGGSNEDVINKVKIGENDRIFIAGETRSQDIDIEPSVSNLSSNSNIWLAEIDNSNGGIIWQKHLSSSGSDYIENLYIEGNEISVIAAARQNGDFSIENEEDNQNKIWLLKFSTDGTLLSKDKIIGEVNENYYLNHSIQNTDGSFFILAYFLGETERFLYQFDSNGVIINKIKFHLPFPEYLSLKDENLLSCISSFEGNPTYFSLNYVLWEIELGYTEIDLFERNTILCIGEEVTYDFADLLPTDNTYLWLNDSTDNPLTLVVEEDSTIVALVSSPEGCVGVSKTHIDAYDFQVIPTITEPNCAADNGEIRLDADYTNSGGVNYQWSNGATTRDLTDIPAGTYSVTATDDNCSIYEEYEVNYTEAPFSDYSTYIDNQSAPYVFEPVLIDFQYTNEKILFLQQGEEQAELMSRPGFYKRFFDYPNVREMLPLSEGNIVLGSRTNTDSILLIEVFSNGVEISTHLYGGSGADYIFDMAEAENGDLIICGKTTSVDGNFSNNQGEFDAFVMRIDSDFNLIWTQTFGGSQNDDFVQVSILSDGTIVAGGNSLSSDGDLPENFGDNDRVLAFYSPSGTLLNTNVYGGSNNDYCTKMRLTPQDDILIFGASYSNDGDVTNGEGRWLMKVNNLGEILWNISAGEIGNGDLEITVDNKAIFTSAGGEIMAVDLADGSFVWKKEVQYSDKIESTEEADIIVYSDTSEDIYSGGEYQVTVYSQFIIPLRFAETPPPFTLPTDTLLCAGDSLAIQMTAPPGFDFHWSNGTVGDSVLFTEPGLHSANLISYGNCKSSDSILLDLCTDYNLESPEPQCYEIVLDAGFAGADYLWSTGDTTYSTIVTDSSWVSLQMTHPDGTIYVDSVFVPVVTDEIVIEPQHNSEVCAGDGSSLIDLTITTNLPYEVNWNNGATTEDLISPVPGFYSVIVSNEFGCTEGEYFTIESTPEITGFISETPVDCHDGSDGIIHFTMTSGQEPYGYLWNTGEIGTSLVGVPAGLYTVSVTDFNGCEISELIFLVNPTELEVTAEINQPTAGNTDGSISLIPSGGNPNYYILWEDGTPFFTRENLSDGWYSATVTDGNGCEIELAYYLGEPVSVKENLDLDFNIFPNPFSDNLIIELDGILDSEVTIFDILGRKMQSSSLSIHENKLVLDTKKWISGTYLIQMKIGEKTVTKRVLK